MKSLCNKSRVSGHFAVFVCSCSNKDCSIYEGQKEETTLKTTGNEKTNNKDKFNLSNSREEKKFSFFQKQPILLTDFDNKLQMLLVEASIRLAYNKQRCEELYIQLWSNYIRTFSAFQHACETHYLEKLMGSMTACILKNLLQEHTSKNLCGLRYMHIYNTVQSVNFPNHFTSREKKSQRSAHALHKVCVVLNNTKDLSITEPQINKDNSLLERKQTNKDNSLFERKQPNKDNFLLERKQANKNNSLLERKQPNKDNFLLEREQTNKDNFLLERKQTNKDNSLLEREQTNKNNSLLEKKHTNKDNSLLEKKHTNEDNSLLEKEQTNKDNFLLEREQTNDISYKPNFKMQFFTAGEKDEFEPTPSSSATSFQKLEEKISQNMDAPRQSSLRLNYSVATPMQQNENISKIVEEEYHPIADSEKTNSSFSSLKKNIFHSSTNSAFNKRFESQKTSEEKDVSSLISDSQHRTFSPLHKADMKDSEHMESKSKETCQSDQLVDKQQTHTTDWTRSLSTNSDILHGAMSSHFTLSSKESSLQKASMPNSILDTFHSMFSIADSPRTQSEPIVNFALKTWFLHDFYETCERKHFDLPDNVHYAYALRSSNFTFMASTCLDYFVLESCVTADATVQDISKSVHLSHSSDIVVTVEGYCSCIYLSECHNVKLVLKSGSRYATLYSYGSSNIELFATKVSSNGSFLIDDPLLQLRLPERNIFQLDLQTLTLNHNPFQDVPSLHNSEISLISSVYQSHKDNVSAVTSQESFYYNNSRDSSRTTTNVTLSFSQKGSTDSHASFVDQQNNDEMQNSDDDFDSSNSMLFRHSSTDKRGTPSTDEFPELGILKQTFDSGSLSKSEHSSLEVEHKPLTAFSCNILDTEENNFENLTTFRYLSKNVKKPTIHLNIHSVNIRRLLCNAVFLNKHSIQSLQCFLKKSFLHNPKQNLQKRADAMKPQSFDVSLYNVSGKHLLETQRFVNGKDSFYDKHLQNTHFKNTWNQNDSILSSYSLHKHLSTKSRNGNEKSLVFSNPCLFATSLTTFNTSQQHQKNALTILSSVHQHLHFNKEQCKFFLTLKSSFSFLPVRAKNIILVFNQGMHFKKVTEETQDYLARKKTTLFSTFCRNTQRVNNHYIKPNDFLMNEKITHSLNKDFILLYFYGIHRIAFNNCTLPFKLIHLFLLNLSWSETKKNKERHAIQNKQIIGSESINLLNFLETFFQRCMKKNSFTRYVLKKIFAIPFLVRSPYAFYSSRIQPGTNLLCTSLVQSIPSYASFLSYRYINNNKHGHDKKKEDIFFNSTTCTLKNDVLPFSSSLFTLTFKTSVLARNSFQNKYLKNLTSFLLQRKTIPSHSTFKKKYKLGNKKQSQTNCSRNMLKNDPNEPYLFSKKSLIVDPFKRPHVLSALTKRVDSQFFIYSKHQYSRKLARLSSLESSIYFSEILHGICHAFKKKSISINLWMHNFCNKNQSFYTIPSKTFQPSHWIRRKNSCYDLWYSHADSKKKHLPVSLTFISESEPSMHNCHLTKNFIKFILTKEIATRVKHSIKMGSCKIVPNPCQHYHLTRAKLFTGISHDQKRFTITSNFKNVFFTKCIHLNILFKVSQQDLLEYQKKILWTKNSDQARSLTFSRLLTIEFSNSIKQHLFWSKIMSESNSKTQRFVILFEHEGTFNMESNKSASLLSLNMCDLKQLKCVSESFVCKFSKCTNVLIEKQGGVEAYVLDLWNSLQYSTIMLGCSNKLSFFPKEMTYLKWDLYKNEILLTRLKREKNGETLATFFLKNIKKKKAELYFIQDTLNLNPLIVKLFKETFSLTTCRATSLFSFFSQLKLYKFQKNLKLIKTFKEWNLPQDLPKISLKKIIISTDTSFSINDLLVLCKKRYSSTFKTTSLTKRKIQHAALEYFKKAIQANRIAINKQSTSASYISPCILKTITAHAWNSENFSIKKNPSYSNDVIVPNVLTAKIFQFISFQRNQLTVYVRKEAKVVKSNDNDNVSFSLISKIVQKNVPFKINCTKITCIFPHKNFNLKTRVVINDTMKKMLKPCQEDRRLELLNQNQYIVILKNPFHKASYICSVSQSQESDNSRKGFIRNFQTNGEHTKILSSFHASSTKAYNYNFDNTTHRNREHKNGDAVLALQNKCFLSKKKVTPQRFSKKNVQFNSVKDTKTTTTQMKQVNESEQLKCKTSDSFEKNHIYTFNKIDAQLLYNPKIILKIHPKITRFERKKFFKL